MSLTVTIALTLLALDSIFIIAVTYFQKWKLLAAGVVIAAILDIVIVYSHNAT